MLWKTWKPLLFSPSNLKLYIYKKKVWRERSTTGSFKGKGETKNSNHSFDLILCLYPWKHLRNFCTCIHILYTHVFTIENFISTLATAMLNLLIILLCNLSYKCITCTHYINAYNLMYHIIVKSLITLKING